LLLCPLSSLYTAILLFCSPSLSRLYRIIIRHLYL
jgi:hypothetical protein